MLSENLARFGDGQKPEARTAPDWRICLPRIFVRWKSGACTAGAARWKSASGSIFWSTFRSAPSASPVDNRGCFARTPKLAPQVSIPFDKFHAERHLGEALDKVHRAEYVRLPGWDRRFIKG